MKKAILFFGLLALFSCEIHFDLEKVSEPAMYVQYLPSSEMDAQIMVAYAEPAFDKPAKQPHPFSVSDVAITVNGNKASVSIDTDKSSWNRHILNVSVPGGIKAGDEITVTVTGKDVPTASATTHVPECPVIKSVTLTQAVLDSSDVWKVTMKLDKPVKEGEYYGIKAVKRNEWYVASGPDMMNLQVDTTKSIEYFNPGQVADYTDLNSLDLDNYVSVSYKDGFMTSEMYMGEFLTLLTSRQIEGDTYTFFANAVDSFAWSDFDIDFDLGDLTDYGDYTDYTDDPGDWEEPEDPEEPEEPEIWIYLGEKNQYRFELYRLSDEFYHYAKAQYLSNYNMLSNFGITPPNFTYTNVVGGLGVVAGISGSGTDWIDPPEIQKPE